MPDEILVKGADGKWYLLRGEELVPYDADTQGPDKQMAGVKQELPKGVKAEAHEKLEKGMKAAGKPSVAGKISLPAVARPVMPAVPAPAPLPSVYVPPELPELVAPSLGPVTHEGHPLYQELQELVERVVKESEAVVRVQAPAWDALLQKRFRSVFSARLRDVRDALETKALLLRDQKIGGLGLREADAQQLVNFIERAFGEFQKKWKDFEAKRIEEWKRKTHEEAARKQEEQKKKEAQEMEERYKRLVGNKGAVRRGAAPSQLQGFPRTEPSVVLRRTRVGAPGSVTEDAKRCAPARPASTPNFVKSQTRAGLREGSPQASHRLDSVPAQDASNIAQAQRPTLPLTAPSSKGKVTDVRVPPKLLGPVQELQALTLQDFRRLGAPAEATAKIKTKVDFLAKESFTKYRVGIKAWQSSPLHRLYLFISGTSLQGRKSIEQVTGDLQAQGKEALTADEFRAIMELNKSLRF